MNLAIPKTQSYPASPDLDLAIGLLKPDQAGSWDSFVGSSAQGTLHHLTAWKRIIEDVFGHETHYLTAESNGHLSGVLPLVRLRSRLFGDYLVSMPFLNYGGGVAETPAIEAALMSEAATLAESLGSSHIEFRDTKPRSGWPVRTDKIAMVLDLPDNQDALWTSIGSKCRAQIKRPQREGTEIFHGGAGLLDDWYCVFARNMRDLGTPVYPKRLFAAIFEAFPESAAIVLLKLKGAPVAGGFLLGYQDRLEIPWASSLREVNRLGINMLLYWEALRYAIERGYRRFDFGRSSAGSGTYRFKLQWGAKPSQLYWHYWLGRGQEMPNLTPHNPKYRMAVGLWQHLPLPMANWLGPKIVKNLP